MPTEFNLDAAAERAQRALDGMTVNRDAMARDVLTMVNAIKAMQARAEARVESKAGGFAYTFDEIFKDLFGPKP